MSGPNKPRVEPGPRNRKLIEESTASWQERPIRASVRWAQNEDGPPALGSPHTNVEGWSVTLSEAMGTASTDFATSQLSALEMVARERGEEPGFESRPINSALAIVQAIAPQDELEAALAVQMAQCHALSCEMLGLAKHAGNLERLQTYSSLAVKFQRTFTAQIEALSKMRGKGQQTVRVEHVTVEAGGQAIVGDVHLRQPGGRGRRSNEEGQPCGTGEAAAGAALLGQDEAGNGLPIPRDAEREMSPARRPVARRTAGES